MLPCEGPGRDIMSVRVRHIPMARGGGGGGPTKSITRFDRLDCGPVAASCRLVSWGRRTAAGAGKEGEGHRNLIFVPWSDLESSSLTSPLRYGMSPAAVSEGRGVHPSVYIAPSKFLEAYLPFRPSLPSLVHRAPPPPRPPPVCSRALGCIPIPRLPPSSCPRTRTGARSLTRFPENTAISTY